MIRAVFQYLFGWPCDHDWETLIDGKMARLTVTDMTNNMKFDNGNAYVWLYRCKKCCKRKKIRT